MRVLYFILSVGILASVMLVLAYDKTRANEDEQANRLYVSPDGNDQNEGTKEKPFRTLAHAAKEAVAGTTVMIREGTYHETLDVKHSGTDGKPVTFRNYENEKVVMSGESVADAEYETPLIRIHNKQYITISGLTMKDLSVSSEEATAMGIYISGSSSHITIKNNHVRDIKTTADEGNAHGIAVYGTGSMKDIKIEGNTVEKLTLGASEAVVLNGNIDGFTIAGNVVRDNNNIGIDLIGYEGTADRNDFVRNGVVENNTVSHNSTYGNPAYGDDYSAGGIYVDGGQSIEIKKNTVCGNDIGIEATSEHKGKYAADIQITDNTVYQNAYTGISIGGYDKERGGTIDSVISHNIVYRNDTKGLYGGQLLLQYDTKNNKIEKNIMTASDSRLFIANDFTKNEGNTMNHNVYHKEAGKDGLWIWKKNEYDSFSSYQNATNNDADSIYSDPMYRDEESYDFTLDPDSPARSVIE
ncbi:right-handed parallel beta-helix repeat-containing protein [Bacillus swezeyi]|uniref:Carbohydrate-binding/sugar hydrolysis domain-containing protein n=1 Tax=Bacillus swezeyi TaxID=1925020 RepID=A0A1R1QK71_9BACI|nr:right-handed parallel beta-helix repeat-containing protein [Bacillus swezeyi]MEC1262098.1 right-handed parallel beta-helix repeat-containing protein [Bacillus swezeyi]MED2928490.1 right-handed parallel beta-helix repeat-containing protein [Bacillus swezeyi]MED2964117.1 right-handed parallel beta-helix repeat-containing protein [Bacillus swezeyi]MED3074010.1 right-handed parallel beta-helix repeat-containing protein [Bacillus swezeyi]MED3083763.1 right-handed parallel beta-helix repeat-conta